MDVPWESVPDVMDPAIKSSLLLQVLSMFLSTQLCLSTLSKSTTQTGPGSTVIWSAWFMRDGSHLLLVIHLRSIEGIKMCRLFCELLACKLALLALQLLVQKSQLTCDPLPTTRGQEKKTALGRHNPRLAANFSSHGWFHQWLFPLGWPPLKTAHPGRNKSTAVVQPTLEHGCSTARIRAVSRRSHLLWW